MDLFSLRRTGIASGFVPESLWARARFRNLQEFHVWLGLTISSSTGKVTVSVPGLVWIQEQF